MRLSFLSFTLIILIAAAPPVAPSSDVLSSSHANLFIVVIVAGNLCVLKLGLRKLLGEVCLVRGGDDFRRHLVVERPTGCVDRLLDRLAGIIKQLQSILNAREKIFSPISTCQAQKGALTCRSGVEVVTTYRGGAMRLILIGTSSVPLAIPALRASFTESIPSYV